MTRLIPDQPWGLQVQDACVGAYCSGYGPTWCMLIADKRCECSACAWVGPEKNACFGVCEDSLCYQAMETSGCHCNEDRCTWDYASKTCVGSCDDYHPSGSHLCVQTADEKCECSKCKWDVAKEMCMGGAGGCGSGKSCNSVQEYGTCQCTNQDCLYDFSLKHCVNWGCSSSKDCVQISPERCTCTDKSSCYYNYDSGSCEGKCSSHKNCIPESNNPERCYCSSM
ncbi:hypothetical protein KIPB_010252 [Kipferlia bialata]|uniref:Uncharacterized protein n=1 Tax=Kipferlia bialata TaxID=797122 RepID=A0A9K3D3M6_9EUKA|nr:hypothetical protein KIPB_010252 [Kipferlia bialata]|eukprot:g10252.t1